MTLVGSECAPCTTAFDSASVSASSILSSLPSAHFISRTTFITLCTTGSTAFRSAHSVTLSLRMSFSWSKLQDLDWESEVEEESDIDDLSVLFRASPYNCQLVRCTRPLCDSRDSRAGMQMFFGPRLRPLGSRL